LPRKRTLCPRVDSERDKESDGKTCEVFKLGQIAWEFDEGGAKEFAEEWAWPVVMESPSALGLPVKLRVLFLWDLG